MKSHLHSIFANVFLVASLISATVAFSILACRLKSEYSISDPRNTDVIDCRQLDSLQPGTWATDRASHSHIHIKALKSSQDVMLYKDIKNLVDMKTIRSSKLFSKIRSSSARSSEFAEDAEVSWISYTAVVGKIQKTVVVCVLGTQYEFSERGSLILVVLRPKE